MNPKTRSFARKFLTFWLNIFFWWYGPLALLVILLAYIFQQDIAALVPYICFCLSILHYVMNSRFEKTNYKKFLLAFLSSFLFFITVTAVPAIPEFFAFEAIDREGFAITFRIFVKTYFLIYFTAFAIPKTWRSDKKLRTKVIWICLYLLGILFFATSGINVNVTP